MVVIPFRKNEPKKTRQKLFKSMVLSAGYGGIFFFTSLILVHKLFEYLYVNIVVFLICIMVATTLWRKLDPFQKESFNWPIRVLGKLPGVIVYLGLVVLFNWTLT